MRRCTQCGDTIIYRNHWPTCACDAIPGLTLTVGEAACFMSMSRGGIYHWIDDGYLAASRSRRPTRVAMFALKALLAAERIAWVNQHATGQDGSS